jgi:tRNA pseudouridine55 synthase
VGLDKTYEATMLLGWSTDTLDSEGTRLDAEARTAEALKEWLAQDLAQIDAELKDFLAHKAQSSFEQVPPQFSAVHVDGKRAYEWARRGVEKELKSKKVHVREATHFGVRRSPEGEILWDFSVRVSAGTYIRAFARDWALELCHFAGHLTRLLRTSVGPLTMEAPSLWQPLQLDDLKPLFDIHYLTADEAQRLRAHGQWKPKPHPRPCLLLGSAESGPVAWTEAQTGKIGRVFARNPLS